MALTHLIVGVAIIAASLFVLSIMWATARSALLSSRKKTNNTCSQRVKHLANSGIYVEHGMVRTDDGRLLPQSKRSKIAIEATT